MERVDIAEHHQMLLSSGKEIFATADRTISCAKQAGAWDVIAKTNARRDAHLARKTCVAIDTRSLASTQKVEATVAVKTHAS